MSVKPWNWCHVCKKEVTRAAAFVESAWLGSRVLCSCDRWLKIEDGPRLLSRDQLRREVTRRNKAERANELTLNALRERMEKDPQGTAAGVLTYMAEQETIAEDSRDGRLLVGVLNGLAVTCFLALIVFVMVCYLP